MVLLSSLSYFAYFQLITQLIKPRNWFFITKYIMVWSVTTTHFTILIIWFDIIQ